MNRKVGFFWLLEIFITSFIVLDLVPQNCAYLTLFILILGMFFMSNLNFLKLYILSIPFFVVLPPNFFSDAMSVWRIVLLVWLVKIVNERFQFFSILLANKSDYKKTIKTLKTEIEDFVINFKKTNYYKTSLFAFLFIGVNVLSLLIAQDLIVGIKKIIFISSIFFLFSIIHFSIKTEKELNQIVKYIFASGFIILIGGYFQLLLTFFITLSDFWGLWYTYFIRAFYGEKMMILLSYSNTWFSYYDGENISPTLRMFSFMPDSHSFAMLMILFSPVCLFLYGKSKDKSKRFFYGFVFMLFSLGVFFSGSRGAWVSWGITLSFTILFYILRKNIAKMKCFSLNDISVHKKQYKMVLISLSMFVLLFPVSSLVLQKSQVAQMRMEGIMTDENKNLMLSRTWSIYDFSETSNKGRIQIWKDSLNSIYNNPLLGVGVGNFPLALGEGTGTAKMGSSAHNIYLDVAVETGLIGLFAFLLLIVNIFIRLIEFSFNLKNYPCRLFSFSFIIYLFWIMTYGFFDVVILNDKVLMFVVIMIAIFYKLDYIMTRKKAEI